jgi:hypothetical protein
LAIALDQAPARDDFSWMRQHFHQHTAVVRQPLQISSRSSSPERLARPAIEVKFRLLSHLHAIIKK